MKDDRRSSIANALGTPHSLMTEKVNWDDVFLSNHYSRVTSSGAWFESAIELVAAAEAVAPLVVAYWASMELWRADKSRIFNEHAGHYAFLMLYAFACENYCKGCLAPQIPHEERQLLRTQGKYPKSLHKHDLMNLTDAVGFPRRGIPDEELLRRLTHAAVWAGRYPVSTRFDSPTRERFSDGKTYTLHYFAANDVERVRDLAGRLRDHVGARASYRVRSAGT
jgi:hypothetical protein